MYKVLQVSVLSSLYWTSLGDKAVSSSSGSSLTPLYLSGFKKNDSMKKTLRQQKIQSKAQAPVEVMQTRVRSSLKSPAQILSERSEVMKSKVAAAALDPKLYANEEHRDLYETNKNNFIHLDSYDTDGCWNDPIFGIGFLANYCFEMDDGSAFLLKTNTHEGTLVQLNYDNKHCSGGPSHVTDMLKAIHATNYNECGDASKFSYLSEYPSGYYTTGVAITFSNEDQCDEKNKYFAYELLISDFCYGGMEVIAEDCPSKKSFTINVYEDEECFHLSTTFDSPINDCLSDNYQEYDFNFEDASYAYKCVKETM